MDQSITEANGQVITVFKGWTARSEKVDNLHPRRPRDVKQPPKASSARILVWSSSSCEPIPPTAGPSISSEPNRPKEPKLPMTEARHFEFVHATDPFRNREPSVRKLVRSHAGRHSLYRKKQTKLQQLRDPSSEGQERESYAGLKVLEQAQYSSQSPDSMYNMNNNSLSVWIPDPTLTISSIKLDPHMTDIIHSLANVSSRMFPRESLFKFNPVSLADWYQFALADKALFHALMYIIAAYSSLFDEAVASNKMTIEFNRCVSVVSKTLAGPRESITDGTIAAVVCLALVEAVKGNKTGWNLHMNGARRIVEARGGFSKLPRSLQMKLLRADITGALDFVAKPNFPFERTQIPSIYATLSFPEFDIASDHLSILLTSYGLDTTLISILTNLTCFSRALDFVLSYPSISIDSLAFVEDTFEIQFGLLSIHEPDFFDEDEVCIQEAMRIGALIFIKETLHEFPLAPSGSNNLVQRLKDALSFISDMKKYASLILWLLFMGGISSKRSQDRAWFATLLMQVLPKNSTWQDIRNVLRKVLWIEKLFGVLCKDFWSEIEIIRTLSS